MSSIARTELNRRLKDFDELMHARDQVCPNGAGRPAQRQGQAIVHGSVVLLSAAFEAFVEELYEEAVDVVYAHADPSDILQLKKNTSHRMNNADTFKVNHLFFNIGIAWIMKMRRIRWQKFSNSKVQKTLNKMIEARNAVAHGKNPGLRKSQAVNWRSFVERLSDRLELTVADELERWGYTRPW